MLIQNSILSNILKIILETCAVTNKNDVEAGELEIPIEGHSTCKNIDIVQEWAVCGGNCNSGAVYDSATGNFKSDCHCCQASDYKEVSVSVVCGDGFVGEKSVFVPTQCECLECSTLQDSSFINSQPYLAPEPDLSNHNSYIIPEKLQRRGMVSLEDIFGDDEE